MAKGSRSSVRKNNNTRLKKKVFGPVEDERTARLSQKLLEIASQPKPMISEKAAQVETSTDTAMELVESKENDNEATTMDVDASATDMKTSSRKAEKRRKDAKSARIEKKRRSKPRNEMVFRKRPAGRTSMKR